MTCVHRPGPRCGSLSLFVWMCVKEIFRLGKDYPFYRPEHCQRCGSIKVWGHGFVRRCIDGYNAPLWLRQWRCDDCDCVHTIRPLGYWPRHQTQIHVIVKSLCHYVTHGFWNKTLGPSRQRQGHWLRALRKNIKARLGLDFDGDLIDGLHELAVLPMTPVARSD